MHANTNWPNPWMNLLRKGLEEDGWPLDWTARATLHAAASATGGKPRIVKAEVVAKSAGIWSADALVATASEFGVKMRTHYKDGELMKKGTVACSWEGPAELVLALERPFLNLAAYASGISTKTQKMVSIVRRACPKNTPRVTSTRKILPAYRDVAILAVMAGGGVAHRVSLSGGVLIKENNVAAAGGIRQAIEGARRVAPHGLKIEVEVRDLDELTQAIAARADVVMFDNFTPAQVAKGIKFCKQDPREITIEVSGGLDEDRIGKYALPGVDVLSVGSLTHSVKITDLSLLVR
jgi:nicotinate-nucleotide pyrophosphorylase (carboxylating)